MALRLIRRGNTGLSNDHNLLLNRGLNDQHPVESITGLRQELDTKYTFPSAGIPKKDLAFPVAEEQDIDNLQTSVDSQIAAADSRISDLSVRTTGIEDWISNNFDEIENNTQVPALVELAIKTDIHEEFTASVGQTEFSLGVAYQPGNKSLKVFKNGVLQRLALDYIELSETIIKFLTALEENDLVTCVSDGRTNINSPIHEEYEYLDDSVFRLAYRYNTGDNGLSVYLNGIRLSAGREYTEVDDYTVQITKTMIPGDLVVFRRETHMAAEVELIDGSEFSQTTWSQRFNVINPLNRVFNLANAYVPGSKTLQVFVGGLLMLAGEDNDYMETGEKQVTFDYDLDLGDDVNIVCMAGLYQWYEIFISVAGQQRFITRYKYTVGKNDILVYEDGLLLSVNDDFEETNYNTVTFLEPPMQGAKIVIYKRR